MTSTDEQFDIVKLMLTNQSKALELIWMFEIWMEWLFFDLARL